MIHGFARPRAARVAVSARGLLLLLVVGWAAVGAGESPPLDLRADVDVAPPPPGLEERMERLAGAIELTGAKALQNVEAVQDVLTRAADSGAIQAIDEFLQTGSAIMLDRSLQRRKGELGALRQWQQQAAKRLVDGLGEHGAEEDLARLARRYPWARRVQEALIERGERALREGRYDGAARAFETAALHADDPALLAQARAGLWLALGLGFGAEAMEQAMAQTPDAEAMPWPGEAAAQTAGQAKALLRRLTAAPAQAQAPLPREPSRRLLLPAPLAGPARFSLEGPDTRCLGPWAIRRVECTGGQWLLFGARGLACYDGATMALRWQQAPAGPGQAFDEESAGDANAPARHAGRPVAAGAAGSSSLAGQAVYALLPGPEGRSDLAALDSTTGRLIWTTQARPEWIALKALGEPTVDQDRLWILAADQTLQGPCLVYLMCLAADDARTIWRQRLGTFSREGHAVARARFACGAALYQGSLYVSTNLGILARCEARAGTVEWLRTYYAPAPKESLRSRDHREGSVPLAAGERVFFAPRDHGGVIALDRQTGQLAWENPLVPSDQIVGLTGGALVVRDANELAALDAATGKRLWSRPADSAGQGPALIAGGNVLAADGNKFLRLAARTGQVVEDVAAPRAPGAEHVLCPDGALVEVREDPVLERTLAPDTGAAPGPLRPPFVKRWALPCRQPLLVLPADTQDQGQRVGVFSENRFYCLALRPACRLAWQMRLAQPLDSAGFHGPMVVLAAGDELTGVDKETGAVRWRKTLPFAPDLVAGDDRTLVAGSSSGPCPVTALSVETGAVLWNRSFAQDPRFAGDRLQRMTLTTEPATLRLYWGKALLAGETRRPAEAIVDPASGATRDVRAFGPLETDWPAEITLGPDSRTDLAPQTTVPRPSRGPFRPDAFAYVGKEAIARFALREGGADLAPGWNPRAEGRWGGQYATPAGAYVKRPGQLAFFDAQARREILFDLPRTPDRAPASGIADFREGPGETLTVVSAAPGSFRPWGFGAIVKTGLRDDAGTGNVTLTAFDPGGAQIGIYCRRLPEAGINPIATLHNWGASEAYRRQHMAMKGISSLGWTKYDIFLYGASGKGTVTINGGRPQEHQGTDFSNPLHRTTFIRGVNYVKVEGVTGDEFLLCYEWDCSGLQIVDASGGAGPRRSLAVRWTTSGPAFRPDEKFGVEVAAGNWYTINKHFALLGGYQADKGPGVIAFVDVFDRKSGKLLGSHPLPSTQPAPPPAPYDGQAKLLDEALLVTDVNGFYVFGSAR